MIENILSENKIKEVSSLTLAFIGDSVHTLFIRDHVVKTENLNTKSLHLLASKYCKAQSQKKIFDMILPDLSADEKEIALQARNHKHYKSAKNASIEDYKKATAFEAIIGYLYLTGKKERLKEILSKSLNI